ncbi:hypothetical protein HJC23_000911 [Cyclotella cryptica]|uniref:Uncharacterized protein n=1 Tax=Cyclotella cryptica TaxID=29204 RepID=A0ABD3QMA6_9STRA|eukprot:CCRYP_004012-RA/>CCRYP_004012-RA protein AED:0.02 eAED:0.02 QI:68/1/1/1/1/1/2/162/953
MAVGGRQRCGDPAQTAMKGFIHKSALLALILTAGAEAFAPASRGITTNIAVGKTSSLQARHRLPAGVNDGNDDNIKSFQHHASPSDDLVNDRENEHENDSHCRQGLGFRRLRRLSNLLQRKSKPVTFAIATAASFVSCLPGQPSRQSLLRPAAAQASAPIVLRAAKPKDDPPMVQAMKKAEQLKKQRSMEEFDRFMQKCNDIEDSQGKKARDDYEKQYQAERQANEAKKAIDLENLKRDLLDEGKDPNTDLDAEREVFQFEHDIDLAKVPGTPQNEQMIRNFRSRGKNTPTFESQRYIVKCQVEDLKARGVDPLAHFSQPEVMDKTRAIYKMDNKVAAKVAKQYEALMDQYGGRLTPAQEGEVPFVRSSVGDEPIVQSSESAREKRAAEKAAAKAKRAAEKAAAKAKLAAEKEAAKKERADQKQARSEAKAKAEANKAEEKKQVDDAGKAAATAAVAAALSSAHMASDSEIAATAGMDFSATAGREAVSHSELAESSAASTKIPNSKELIKTIRSHATVKNVGTVVIAGGATVYGINYYKENNSAAQEERERQLKLIMGVSDDDDDDEDDFESDIDDDEDDEDDLGSALKNDKEVLPPPKQETPKAKKQPPAPVSEPPPPTRVQPKRKLGIFSKKNANARETDLNVLISPNAEAPEFATLLAKILTFGAPGRFPAISSMGEIPFDEFDLEKAKEMLSELRSDLDLSDEKSAEIFASVVNCMIIDIVDLASSTLKAKDKDEKLTVDAINVVMDFMDHAASLFDAVAKDVTIKPVTYGGNLKKKELEQMFSIYAGSSMMSLVGGGTSQDRVDTLQLVFDISDKKAEGLMQKHMMKMMMNLMKDGGKGMEGMMEGMPGMEGMEDMMKAMGGMPGMPGLDGDLSPEDLKQTVKMMKDLMDSGQVSQEELAEIRKQFKDMYGSDISDLIKQADKEGAGAGMGEDERELLDMFKRILGE